MEIPPEVFEAAVEESPVIYDAFEGIEMAKMSAQEVFEGEMSPEESVKEFNEAIESGNAERAPVNLRAQAKKIIEQTEIMSEGTGRALGLELDAKLGAENFDEPAQNPKAEENSAKMQETLEKLQESIEKSGKTNEEIAELLEKKSASEADSKTSRALKTLAVISAAMPALIAAFAALKGGKALQGMADAMSGCYENNYKTHEQRKLSCSASKELENACMCAGVTGLPSALSAECADVNPDHKCPEWTYMYKKVTVGALLADFVRAIANIPKVIAKNYKKWLLVFFIVIVLVFLFRYALNYKFETVHR